MITLFTYVRWNARCAKCKLWYVRDAVDMPYSTDERCRGILIRSGWTVATNGATLCDECSDQVGPATNATERGIYGNGDLRH